MTDQPLLTGGTVLMHQVGSIAIEAAGYDHVQHALVIRFHKSNRTIVYSDVPLEVWQDFMASEKKNSYYATYIKDLFPWAIAEVTPIPITEA